MNPDKIREILTNCLKEGGFPIVDFDVEHPKDLNNGDYASNVALVLGQISGQNPLEISKTLVSKIKDDDKEYLERAEAVSPGFINFFLKKEFFKNRVKEILEQGDNWGKNEAFSGKKIIIEYSQPNPFKPFHIGHLMSTTIGESLSRLIEFSGAKVRRFNYHGDIGLHVAKCIWGLMKKNLDAEDVLALGEAYVYGNRQYEEDENSKKEIDDINRRLYEKDPLLMDLYEKGKAASLSRFLEIYSVLGSSFDEVVFESDAVNLGLLAVEEGLKKNIFEKSDGAIVFKGEKHGLHTRVFVTSKGAPTYETKELGLFQIKKEKFPFDLNITTVAVEQDGYFKVIEKVIDLLWPDWVGKYTHVSHGMMQLQEGKMSSRKGNVITGESLIEEMRKSARLKMEGRDFENIEKVADMVAVSAIKYSVLKQKTGKNAIFDPEKSLSLEGDSGPYLQYANTRALSVLKKSKEEGIVSNPEKIAKTNEVQRLLYRFPEEIKKATLHKEPHYLVTYLTELAGAFNSWYGSEKIIDKENPNSAGNVSITEAFAITMKRGLSLLGMGAPDKM